MNSRSNLTYCYVFISLYLSILFFIVISNSYDKGTCVKLSFGVNIKFRRFEVLSLKN